MKIPEKMHAVVLTGHGGMEKLSYHTDWPVPVPGSQDVLIKVGACGMNNTDVNTRVGWYSKAVTESTAESEDVTSSSDDPSWGGNPLSFPRIQGADVCGTIVSVGSEVDQGLVGQRVITDTWLRDWDNPMNRNATGYFGSECDGGFAQYTKTDYRNVGVINSTWTDEELATFACSYSTAEGMLTRANVDNTDTVLVTGGSGGVGSALIQLAKRRGAKVAALASESKHPLMEKLGADLLLPRSPSNIKAALNDMFGCETVSVIADVVGGPDFSILLDTLERGGRYTCSGAIAGPVVDLDLRTLYLRDLTFTGSTVIPPHIFKDLIAYIEREEIKPMLAASYPLSEFKEAQQNFIDKQFVGNIVVCPS